MRNPLHLCLSAVLAIVSIGAPFAHTHEAGKAEKHLAQEHFSILHAHIPLPSADPALSEVDGSAQRVNWFRFELEKPVALAPPASDSALRSPSIRPAGWAPLDAAQPIPEESPPRAISPRGPPSPVRLATH